MPHGIDLSHHQNPSAMPWVSFAETSHFAIVRATYGSHRDRMTGEHIARARGVGLKVGLYHFFRPTESATDQMAAFQAVSDRCGIGPGDIIPALDIEADGKREVTPDWGIKAHALCDVLARRFGDCLIYITQRDWALLGKPEWVLQRPLWVAHWTTAKQPATPAKKPWTIWQYRVGPYRPGGTGGYHQPAFLDHNWCERLPLIAQRDTMPEIPPPPPGGIYDEQAGVCRPDTLPAPPPEPTDENS